MEDDFEDFHPAEYHADGRPKRRPTGDYEVGYAKPPASTRWPKGVSGNPKGKKPGVRNYATELGEEMAELVTVEISEREKAQDLQTSRQHQGDREQRRQW